MAERTWNFFPKTGIVLFLFFLLIGALAIRAPGAFASSGYFSSQGCSACHTGVSGSNFCGMCHAHGTHSSSSKNDINVKGTPNKSSYAPGETVSVQISGGYRSSQARAILYDQNGTELAVSTGTGGIPVNAPVWPVTLTAPAPAAPGSYTWKIAWYGNKYDTGSAAFGTGGSTWTPDPNNANHGWETVPIASFTVSAPTDTSPPTVSSTGPANNATNVNPGTAVTATFSEAVTNVTSTTFTVAGVTGAVSMNGAGTVATFTPSAALASSTTYTATITGGTSGVKDASGNALASNYSWSFTTAAAADTAPPTVSTTNPANNANNVAVNTAISATFSENILPSSVTTSSFTVNGVTGNVSVSGATATFTPSSPLAYATAYTATITTAVTDLASNHLAQSKTWSFTTGAAADTTPPTVSSTAPVNNATAVPVSSTVAATFSEAMKGSTITTGNFQLKQGSTNVPGTVTLNGAGTMATFQPTSPLAGGATYTATVTTGVQDAAGNAMAADKSWSFTTSAAADTAPPSVNSVTPADGAKDIAVNASLTATFSEAVDPKTVTGATFTLKNGSVPVGGSVSVSGATATFKPGAPLSNSTTYTAVLTTGIQDLAGNALASGHSWSFTTGATADTTAPTVTSISPAGNATGVPVTAAVTAAFSEPLDAATVTTATFTLKDNANAAVAGAVTYDGTTATFAPSSLAPGTNYTATLTTGIKDAAGNAMAQEHVWSFTTGDALPATDSDNDGAVDAVDDYPNDDRIATVQETRHNQKIKVDVSEHSGACLRGAKTWTDSDPSINQHGKPTGYEFKWGLVEYNVEGISPGASVRVKLTFPEGVPAGSKVYQVTSSGYGELPNATISGNVVTLSLTDGGTGDRDLQRNGVIVDPVGVASPVASAPGSSGGGCSTTGADTPDDVSGAWGAMLFAGLLFVLRGRRRRDAV
jgi:MYXO-CTERM domain-containing protein